MAEPSPQYGLLLGLAVFVHLLIVPDYLIYVNTPPPPPEIATVPQIRPEYAIHGRVHWLFLRQVCAAIKTRPNPRFSTSLPAVQAISNTLIEEYDTSRTT